VPFRSSVRSGIHFDYISVGIRSVGGISTRFGYEWMRQGTRGNVKNAMLQGGKESESVKVGALIVPGWLSPKQNENTRTRAKALPHPRPSTADGYVEEYHTHTHLKS